MSLTRDAIQGFIDGYLKAGGTNIKGDIDDWMANHPQYPLETQLKAVVLSDLDSYRGIVQPAPVQAQPTPTPVQVTPVP